MSNISLVIEERAALIGNFMVGRLLPFRQKRMVGPFIFIDHMGPAVLDASEQFDVLAHPHIGLSTLTFLFEGSIMHRDSLGNALEITPGAVNWMTAGKGIVHSERSPQHLRNTRRNLHGLQIWVALPKQLEQCEPSFVHVESEKIPSWNEGGLSYKLIAGELQNVKSPVPVYSKLFFLEIKSKEKQIVQLDSRLFGEAGLYILEGEVEAEGNRFHARQLLITNNGQLCAFSMEADTTVYIFGGEPLPEERFIDWNFVSSDKSQIEEAKRKWLAKEFPKIKGEEHEFVPYPSSKK